MFDFLFGRKQNETTQPDDTVTQKKPGSPGTSIDYDPNLIAELKSDHAQLISLFTKIVSTTSQRNDQLLTKQLNEFGQKLRGHLRRATHWVARISRRDPKLWARWQMGVRRGSVAGAV